MNVNDLDWPDAMVPVWNVPPSPVAVWEAPSLFVQRTVSPTLMDSVAGWNLLPVMATSCVVGVEVGDGLGDGLGEGLDVAVGEPAGCVTTVCGIVVWPGGSGSSVWQPARRTAPATATATTRCRSMTAALFARLIACGGLSQQVAMTVSAVKLFRPAMITTRSTRPLGFASWRLTSPDSTQDPCLMNRIRVSCGLLLRA